MPSSKVDMTVLFVHGLESSPRGYKVQKLRKRYQTVLAPDMEMSIFNIRKKHSIIRNLIRVQVVPFFAFAAVAAPSLYMYASHNQSLKEYGLHEWQYQVMAQLGAFVLYAVTAFGIPFFRKILIGRALKRSFQQCCDVQKNFMNSYGKDKIDLVVGSSWGGAVLCQLIKDKVWQGPSILICPAYSKVMRTMNNSDDKPLPIITAEKDQSPTAKYLILHGTKDETIPYQDSEQLVEANPGMFDLKRVENGDHRLRNYTKNELYQTIEEYMRQK